MGTDNVQDVLEKGEHGHPLSKRFIVGSVREQGLPHLVNRLT